MQISSWQSKRWFSSSHKFQIVTSESTTTTTQYVGSDTDDTELDEESFTSIISLIDEEPAVTPKQAPASTKRSTRIAKQSK